MGLVGLKNLEGDYKSCLSYSLIAYEMDTLRPDAINSVFMAYGMLGQFQESLKYGYKLIDRLEAMGRITPFYSNRLGYIFSKTGNHELADFHFKQKIEHCDKIINNELSGDRFYALYDRAGVYAYQGKRDKAFEDLDRFKQRETLQLWMVTLINNDPLLDSIRDEPKFQQIVQDVEAKYQAEHERVRQWLEENDML